MLLSILEAPLGYWGLRQKTFLMVCLLYGSPFADSVLEVRFLLPLRLRAIAQSNRGIIHGDAAGFEYNCTVRTEMLLNINAHINALPERDVISVVLLYGFPPDYSGPRPRK